MRFLPAVLAVVLAGAILNPFCCNRLPPIGVEPVQTETAFDNEDKRCPGKPEAVRAEADIAAPEPEFFVSPWLAPRASAEVQRGRGSLFVARSAAPPPLARHKWLGIYRV